MKSLISTAVGILIVVISLAMPQPASAATTWETNFYHIFTDSVYARGRMDVITQNPNAPSDNSPEMPIFADGHGSISVEVYQGDAFIGSAEVALQDQPGVGDPDNMALALTIHMGLVPGPSDPVATFENGTLSCVFGSTFVDGEDYFEGPRDVRIIISVRGNVDLAAIKRPRAFTPDDEPVRSVAPVFFAGRGMGEVELSWYGEIGL